MRRIWTAISILLIILIIGGVGMYTVYHQTDSLSKAVDEAKQAGLAGDISKALDLAKEINSQWIKSDFILSTIIRHDQVESAIYSIKNMVSHLEQEKLDEFIDDCNNCAIALDHIWTSEIPSLENIL